jgi:carbonic anhydrase
MAQSLEHLLDRNVAWAAGRRRGDPDFFRRTAEQKTPSYLWIGCSDSRVMANDVLGLDPGEVFVHRNIANIVHTSDMNVLSVLEFANEHLRVEHIIVCGHYGCSGVQRALADERGAILDHWLQPISMLYRKHRKVFDAIEGPIQRLDRLCEINVELQVRRVAATPIVENAWTRGQPLYLHGWIYAIQDGLIRDLAPHISSNLERDAQIMIGQRVLQPVEPQSAMRRQALAAFRMLELPEMASPKCCMPPRETPPGKEFL